MAEFHDEKTLLKVRDALYAAGVANSRDAITSMQNAGILFRENADEVQVEREVTNTLEITEEMLLTRDQGIRVQAIDIAVRSIAPAENFGGLDGYTQHYITRAEMFEDYIRNGVIHNG